MDRINHHFLFSIVALFLILSPLTQANDTVSTKRYTFGAIPIFSYDPDLGLRYGAVLNVFDYGQDKRTSDYEQYLKLLVFNSTKGTSTASVLYETERLFPATLSIIEFDFRQDTKLDFFGFNGKRSVYRNNFILPDNQGFINRDYYKTFRKMLRVRADFHISLPNKSWKIMLGSGWNSFSHKPADENGPTLYQDYIDWEVLRPGEHNGGANLRLLSGISYDTRNHRVKCSDGVWFETYLVAYMRKKGNHFGKHVLSLRGYTHGRNINSVFSWRISSQQKVFGNTPFYALPFFIDSRQDRDGLGGAFNLRGVIRNRIVSDGFILGNTEWRTRVVEVDFLKLNWELELSAFADAAYISQEYKVNLASVPEAALQSHFNLEDKQLPIVTLGVGAYIVYNKYNITSVNFGWSPDKRFGSPGIYVGSSYLF